MEPGFLENNDPPRPYPVVATPCAANRSEGAHSSPCTTWEGPKIKRAPLRKGALEPAKFAGLETEGK